jgi:hypothetical protein
MRVLICLLLLNVACSKPPKQEPVPPPGLAGSAQVGPAKNYEGLVEEVIERDQFDYVRIGSNWFALVGASLKTGQKVKIEEQVVFDNFQSKTLNRTFPKIIFGKLLSPKPANSPKPVKSH